MNKNKITCLLLLGILIFLCFSVLGQAAVEISSGLISNKVVFEVSYENLDQDDDDTETLNYSRTLTFTNTGNSSEAVAVSIPSGSVTSGYTLNLNDANSTTAQSTLSFTLANASSRTITLNAVVPIKVDSGNHSIGTLTVNGANHAIETQVKSMLKIEDIQVYVNNTREDSVDADGEKIDEIRPGKEVELRFDIKNLFDDDYDDGDIDNIELTVKLDDDDFGDDVDEEEEFDLGAGEEEEDLVIAFNVPGNVEDGSYDLEIELEGTDDNGAKHTVSWVIELEIDRERDDVQIENAYLTASSLSCARNTQLRVKIVNYGRNRQRNAALSIYNEALGVNVNVQEIYLDDDPDDNENEYSKIVPISLSDDLAAGVYPIEIRAYINGDEQVAYRDISLTVVECPTAVGGESTTEGESEQNESEEVVVVVSEGDVSAGTGTPAVPSTGVVSGGQQIIETRETSFAQIQGLVIFMGIITVLLIVLIALVVYVLVKKK